MTRKTVRLTDTITAVVEPVDPDSYEAAGDRTLIHLKVVELLATKEDINEE